MECQFQDIQGYTQKSFLSKKTKTPTNQSNPTLDKQLPLVASSQCCIIPILDTSPSDVFQFLVTLEVVSILTHFPVFSDDQLWKTPSSLKYLMKWFRYHRPTAAC